MKLDVAKKKDNYYPDRLSSNYYYSGSDVRVYFGDMWVDQIVDIQFQLIESVAPIFGYNSYTYDAVARGNRIVQGQFTVQFTEVGYMQTILKGIAAKMTKYGKAFTKDNFEHVFDKGGKRKDRPIHTLITDFDKYSEAYENAIWGSAHVEVNERKTNTFFYPDSNNNMDILQRKGFNILITYGGACVEGRPSNSYKTAQSIIGVQIQDVVQRVDPGGNVVQETYSFIAKDISGNMEKQY
ncbi:MAG: hypothetical protein ACRC5C_12125 [Bacilli bacterium]